MRISRLILILLTVQIKKNIGGEYGSKGKEIAAPGGKQEKNEERSMGMLMGVSCKGEGDMEMQEMFYFLF